MTQQQKTHRNAMDIPRHLVQVRHEPSISVPPLEKVRLVQRKRRRSELKVALKLIVQIC